MKFPSILTLALIGVAATRVTEAQVPRGGSWELGGGVVWAEGFSGPTRPAELTRNGELDGGFELFTSEGTLGNSAGVGGTLAYYLTQSVALEAGFRYAKPRLSFELTGDAEDAPDVSAEETLARYVFTGSVVWHIRQLTFGQRAVPYVIAGAGHVRDLHEGDELVETGAEYHLGGGLKYWLGAGRRRFGIRGQAGFSIADGGFDFRDEGTRTLPFASASLVYLF